MAKLGDVLGYSSQARDSWEPGARHMEIETSDGQTSKLHMELFSVNRVTVNRA